MFLYMLLFDRLDDVAHAAYIIYYIVVYACWWRVLMKADRNGVQAIIPFYNVVVRFEIALPDECIKSVIAIFVFWILYLAEFPWPMVLIAGAFALWAQIRFDVALVKAFGQKTGLVLFFIFLYPLAMLYLAFNPNVVYKGKPKKSELELGIVKKIGHCFMMISDPRYIRDYKEEQSRAKKYEGNDDR